MELLGFQFIRKFRLFMKRLALCSLVMKLIACPAQPDVAALLRSALAARSQGDRDKAIRYFTQAIETGDLSNADLAIVLRSRGVTFDMNGQVDAALADFDAAIQLRPKRLLMPAAERVAVGRHNEPAILSTRGGSEREVERELGAHLGPFAREHHCSQRRP
jgi:tetratricopeptide (TPR) repeat protein